ncbi:hypothetical protein IFR05_012829 [Cadophora sp. M221]|nr:hypothetical protein IFR05_012829 [Cadophora sp. M221]
MAPTRPPGGSSATEASRTMLSNSQPLRPSLARAAKKPIPSRIVRSSAVRVAKKLLLSRQVRSSSAPAAAKKVLSITDFTALVKPSFLFYCGEHTKDIKDKSALTRHIKDFHKGDGLKLPYKCTKCDEQFLRPFSRKRHTENVHDKLRQFNCETCTDPIKDFLILGYLFIQGESLAFADRHGGILTNGFVHTPQ